MNELVWVLFGIAMLSVVLVVIQGIQVPLVHGFAWGLGNRDEPKSPTEFMLRMERIWSNHLQSLAMALPLLLILLLSQDAQSNIAITGAQMFLFARIGFSLIYMIGIPYLRSFVWSISLVGILFMVIGIMPF